MKLHNSFSTPQTLHLPILRDLISSLQIWAQLCNTDKHLAKYFIPDSRPAIGGLSWRGGNHKLHGRVTDTLMRRHYEYKRARCETLRESTSLLLPSICRLSGRTPYTINITTHCFSLISLISCTSKLLVMAGIGLALAFSNPRLQPPLTPQGKVAELRHELQSGGKKDKNHSAKKIALKRIVANMTMSNNDMVALFPDVINCMQIPNLEIKKM